MAHAQWTCGFTEGEAEDFTLAGRLLVISLQGMT